MSFSDMMSSGRGPGVIGMVMALFVLIGFGLLFMFAYDDSLQGGDMTIEAVIRQQDKEIESLKANAESGGKTLAGAPAKLAAAKDLSRLKTENASTADAIKVLVENVEAGNAAVAAATTEFEAYKDQYRALVRGQAKGQNMEKLETTTGEVYMNVSIREVTAVGIQIRHDAGHKRIAFEDLSEELKDYYQFDPAQKDAAIAHETATRDEHEAAVAVATEAAEKEMGIQREKDKAEAREKLLRDIALKETQISSLSREIRGLEADVESANREASAARASGKMHINKAGSIRGKVRSAQNRLATLRAELGSMKSRL